MYVVPCYIAPVSAFTKTLALYLIGIRKLRGIPQKHSSPSGFDM
jgi:hypothetical protein